MSNVFFAIDCYTFLSLTSYCVFNTLSDVGVILGRVKFYRNCFPVDPQENVLFSMKLYNFSTKEEIISY